MKETPLSSTWLDHVDLARQVADDFKDESFQHQIVALCLRNNKVLGYGVNQRRYARGMSVFLNSLHAEADLLRRLGDRVANGKIFLYRFNNAEGSPFVGEPKCAKPCLLCGHILREAKVSKVIFLNPAGEVEGLDGSELPMLRLQPALLTRMFLERGNEKKHGKFVASDYLKEE